MASGSLILTTKKWCLGTLVLEDKGSSLSWDLKRWVAIREGTHSVHFC